MTMDRDSHFIDDLGFRQVLDEGGGRGWGWIVPALCVPDTEWPHVSVLFTVSDMVTGMLASAAAEPRVAVTVDLRTRIVRAPPLGQYTSGGRILRTGASLTVCEATLRSAGDDAPFAVSVGTFMASPRPVDVMPALPNPTLGVDRPDRPTLTTPFIERVGIRVLEPGIAEVAMRPDLMNPTATFQGGITALLGETAAQTLASDRAGTTFVVDDLDVRYLRAARVGPARATATLHQLDDELASATVEVRDTGMDDRLTTYITAECRRL